MMSAKGINSKLGLALTASQDRGGERKLRIQIARRFILLVLTILSLQTRGKAAVLIGNSTIAPSIDMNVSGQAEAFQFTAGASGTLSALVVYVDSNSASTTIVAGLYSNASGHPGTLIAQGSLSNPITGGWNSVIIPATAITGGTSYWIAFLGTGGVMAFRDQCCPGGTLAENSVQTTLTSLPSTWSSGPKWSNGPPSVYGGAPDAPAPPEQVGSWSPLMNWPIVAAHSILMPNGTLLVMDGWVAPSPADVFDPATGLLASVVNPFGIDIFCSGHVPLADGRVIIAGGHGFSATLGIKNTSIFNPIAKTWTAGPSMNFARWYPTVTRLGDGRLVAISGNITQTTWADSPEIYDPVANKWSVIPGISTTQVHEEEYPLSFLLPSGKIFTMATSAARSYILDPLSPSWGAVGGQTLFNGSAVMYLPGKILYSGGGTPLNSTSLAQAGAQVIDLNSPTPTWQTTSSMKTPRYAHTLTVLPDGKVLAIGGGANMDQSDVLSGTLTTEQWEPATGQWTLLASMDVPRVYHSTAVLLPDGRVLSAGGGHAEGTSSPAESNAQYFSPPYLFKGVRPSITSVPSSASLGSTISVGTPDAASIASVVLISLAADTHTLDMNQHFVPLTFTSAGNTLNVDMPSSSSVAPPGYYMLFILNSTGVPCVAPFIQLLSGPAPVTVPDVVGQTQDAATNTINGAGLIVGAVSTAPSTTVPQGSVASQIPAGGTPAAPGSSVNLVISTGPPPPVTVPDVVGQSRQTATNNLITAGLVPGTISTASSTAVLAGSVISENPVAGTQVPGGSAVDLTISSGPPTIATPNVVGQAQPTAGNTITNADLIVGTVSDGASSTVPVGSVMGQSPAAGVQVILGSAVNLTICTGAPPVTIAVDKLVFSDGSSTRTTAAFSTSGADRILVAFASSDGPTSGGQQVTITGAGLTWQLVKRSNVQAGSSEIWWAAATNVLTNVTVKATQKSTGYHQSVTVVAFSGAKGVGASNVASAGTGAPTVTVTTTAANSLVYGVGNDWDSATSRGMPTGQALAHQWVDTAVGDTFWVQATSSPVPTPSAVQIRDTSPTTDRWNLAGVEILGK